LVHGTAADEASYRGAIVAAQIVKRLVLVETASEFAEPWGTYLARRRISVTVLSPQDGRHPLPLTKAELQ
jgi:hypothetical protein